MDKISVSPEELSELIGLVYDSAFEEHQWKSFLDRICRLFPGVMACVYGYENEVVLPQYVLSGANSFLDEEINLSGVSTLERLSVSQAFGSVPIGWVNRTKRYFSADTWNSLNIYQKYLKPMGMRHSLQLKIDGLDQRGAVIAISIPEDADIEARVHDPLFDLLKLLSPHIVRALKLARALTLAKRSTGAFSGFLDGIILPMLVTDVKGRYLFGNSAGRNVLQRGEPVRLESDGRLALMEEFETTDLYRKLQQTNSDLVQRGMKVQTKESLLMLAISPFHPSMRDASAVDKHLLSEESLFAIFVGQSAAEAINAQLLEDVFDLTAREAEVCKLILLGKSVTAIATTAARSPKTIRNQVQAIHEKVGVSSNTELMAALSVFRTVGTLFEDGSHELLPHVG